MKKSRRCLSLTIVVCVLVLLAGIGFSDDQARPKLEKKGAPQPQVVAKIVDIEYAVEKINPPNLVVAATGEVPTAYQSRLAERVTPNQHQKELDELKQTHVGQLRQQTEEHARLATDAHPRQSSFRVI